MNKINSRGRDRLIMLQSAAVRPKKLELERALLCRVYYIRARAASKKQKNKPSQLSLFTNEP